MENGLLIVERIEDGVVSIEKSENEHFNIKLSEFDCDIHEGDVLKCVNGKYFVDEEKTKELRRISAQLDKIVFGG